MKNVKKVSGSILVAIVSILIVLLISPKTANADSSSIGDKWLATMFTQCLNAGPNSPISSETITGTLADAVFSGKGTSMNLPTFDYLGVGVGSMNCMQVLQGAGALDGVFARNGISPTTGWDDIVLQKLGYSKTASDEIYEFNIQVSSASYGQRMWYDSDEVTGARKYGKNGASKMEDGNWEPLDEADDIYRSNSGVYNSVTVTAKRNEEGILVYSYSNPIKNYFNDVGISFEGSNLVINIDSGCSDKTSPISIPLLNDIGQFYNEVEKLKNKEVSVDCVSGMDTNTYEGYIYGWHTTYNFGTNRNIINSGVGGEFSYTGNTSSVVSNFNMNTSDLTEDEKYELYVFYLNNAVDITSQNRISCEEEDGLREVHLKDDSGKWRKYYINTQNVRANDFAIKGSTGIMQGDLNTLISWFNQHPAEEFTEEELEDCKEKKEGTIPSDMSIDKVLPDRTGGDEMDDQPCFDGGVGSLGWIICPIIKLLRQTTENLYDYVITPFLEIDVGAFDTSSAMFQGWQTFQSFANIVFVIILILVILSQVTGYGIDNYGIKRMLPKIIVGAILVNLSFIICQLLVDISNIVGFSMENMFDNLASQAMSNAGGAAVGNNGTAIGATIISGAVGIGGAAAAIYTAEIWLPVIILPLLLGLISIIISCLFMFIILGARRAVAIILVVISPLAFVMYMLPNTRKLFDRWMSAFKAVLVLFPICGLLMGGGAFAGAILWNVSGDFFLGQLLAALTTVIPFFFIPRILKSSLNAVGNLGTTLSNIGNGISRGLGGITKGAVGNSNWYNNMQNNRKDILEERNRNREQERAQRIVDNLRGRQSRGETLSDRQTRRLARYQQRVLAGIKEQGDVDRLSSPEYAAAANTKIQNELEEAQIATEQSQVEASDAFVGGDYNSVANEMVDLMRSDTNGSNSARIKALQNALNKVGDDGRTAMDNAMTGMDFSSISKEARQAWASNAMSQHAAEWKNNARSLFEAAKANTGASASGNYNDFVPGGTSAAKITSYRPEQFANMDDGQFEHLMKEYRGYQRTLSTGGTLSADQQARLDGMQNIAAEVMSNPNLQGALKGQRAADVASMAGNVLNVRANQQADARASAQWRGVTDADLQNIVTDSRSTPQERAQAQAEINRRSGSSSP